MANKKTHNQPQSEGSIHDIPFQDAQGNTRTLGEFRGESLLIVNTASY